MSPWIIFVLAIFIVLFFIMITVHFLRMEKELRASYLLTEEKVATFLKLGQGDIR